MTLSLVTAPAEETPPIAEKRVCPICKTEFEKNRVNQKCCSSKCQIKNNSRNYYAANREKILKSHKGWAKTHIGHRRKWNAKYRAANKDILAQKQRARHAAVREWIHGIKASLKCSRCGESRPICLDFHHLDGSNKEYAIAVMTHKNYSKESFAKEMAKCVVLCRNCHAVEHWERRTEESL